MKRIFTYGILQKHHSAKQHGLKDDMYRGRGCLKGFERNGLTHIKISKDESSSVEGDIWEVPDELEERLFNFESSFGYERQTATIKDENVRYHTSTVYLVDWRGNNG